MDWACSRLRDGYAAVPGKPVYFIDTYGRAEARVHLPPKKTSQSPYLCDMKSMYIYLLLATIFAGSAACKNTSEDAIKAKRKEEMTNKENRVSPAATASATIGGNTVTVNYSSPAVKGRPIWGALVPYDQVWRTGANEATMVTFTQDVTIMGQALNKRTYALFTIPTADVWTVIFNYKETQWGAFKYDAAEDALRVSIKPEMLEESVESLTFQVISDDTNNGGVIRLRWEKLQLDIPFNTVPESK